MNNLSNTAKKLDKIFGIVHIVLGAVAIACIVVVALIGIAYALKLYADVAEVNYGPMLAMSVLSITPIIILFFLFQKTLVDGISTSGIKG